MALRSLPGKGTYGFCRLGEKHEQKLLKALEDYRRIGGRFLISTAEELANKLTEHLKEIDGIDKISPAGSLRRGRETIGDLDILVTGDACADDVRRAKIIEHIVRFPGLLEVIAQGENKISFRMRSGIQVDVDCYRPNLLEPRCNTSPAPRLITLPCGNAL